jgi:hypothetical protein
MRRVGQIPEATGPSALLARAQAWVAEVHPHARHLERTHDWLLALDPDATEGMRIAAAVHDIERAYPDESSGWDSARDWDSEAYNRWHQDRCAEIAARWLREQGSPAELVAEVEALVRVHEDGGWREADLVQAADSLSFLETMVGLVVGWVETGRAPRASAEAKLRHSVQRMNPQLTRAREFAAPMYEDGLRRVAEAREPSAR